MDFDMPGEDAYGRVSDAERFRPVVAAALELIQRLEEKYQVSIARSDGEAGVVETLRIDPRAGASLSFMITDFPGVGLVVEGLPIARFPNCGCDACNEAPADLINAMESVVWAIADGRYEEEVNETSVIVRLWGTVRAEIPVDIGDWRVGREAGLRAWPKWPERGVAGSDKSGPSVPSRG